MFKNWIVTTVSQDGFYNLDENHSVVARVTSSDTNPNGYIAVIALDTHYENFNSIEVIGTIDYCVSIEEVKTLANEWLTEQVNHPYKANTTYPNIGDRVITAPFYEGLPNKSLGSTDGILVAKQYLHNRNTNAKGVVHSFVAGHGGDVWFVKHDDGKMAVYSYTEFMTIEEKE